MKKYIVSAKTYSANNNAFANSLFHRQYEYFR